MKILNFVKSDENKPFQIKNKSDTKAEIIIYDRIGKDWFGFGISAKDFSDELKKIPASVTEIEVRINSPGGSVFEGVAIYNRLKQHKAKKTVYIDGLAASIASIIALSGDEIFIGEGALFMVHLPMTWAEGNRVELDNIVSRLMDIEEQMLGIYSKKSGLDRSEIRAMLEAETWLDADQALEKGFVTAKVEETLPIAASIMEGCKWFNKAPKKYFSDTKAAELAKQNLKSKIAGTLATKK